MGWMNPRRPVAVVHSDFALRAKLSFIIDLQGRWSCQYVLVLRGVLTRVRPGYELSGLILGEKGQRREAWSFRQRSKVLVRIFLSLFTSSWRSPWWFRDPRTSCPGWLVRRRSCGGSRTRRRSGRRRDGGWSSCSACRRGSWRSEARRCRSSLFPRNLIIIGICRSPPKSTNQNYLLYLISTGLTPIRKAGYWYGW